MPRRTKEQLEQIHADILVCIECSNRLDIVLYPRLLNGKSWAEERKEYFDEIFDNIDDVLSQMRSCEIKVVVEEIRTNWERTQRRFEESAKTFFPLISSATTDAESTYIGDYTLIEVEEGLQHAINGTLSSEGLTKLEKFLNDIGSDECQIRACKEFDIEHQEYFAQTSLSNISRDTGKTI